MSFLFASRLHTRTCARLYPDTTVHELFYYRSVGISVRGYICPWVYWSMSISVRGYICPWRHGCMDTRGWARGADWQPWGRAHHYLSSYRRSSDGLATVAADLLPQLLQFGVDTVHVPVHHSHLLTQHKGRGKPNSNLHNTYTRSTTQAPVLIDHVLLN